MRCCSGIGREMERAAGRLWQRGTGEVGGAAGHSVTGRKRSPARQCDQRGYPLRRRGSVRSGIEHDKEWLAGASQTGDQNHEVIVAGVARNVAGVAAGVAISVTVGEDPVAGIEDRL